MVKKAVVYLLRYIGKAPWKLMEYNGKRYYFSKKRPEKEVPADVYKYVTSSRTGHEDDFVVVESTAEKAPETPEHTHVPNADGATKATAPATTMVNDKPLNHAGPITKAAKAAAKKAAESKK